MEFQDTPCMPSKELSASQRRLKVMYLQYTNPAAYPPLEHSSRIMANRGWRVIFFGAPALGADSLRFPDHHNVKVRRLPYFGSGALQKAHYVGYIFWSLLACLWLRPAWLYVSEPMAALPALIIQRLSQVRVLYHEHDSPMQGGTLTLFQRLFQRSRVGIARTADLVVLPQKERLASFVAETARAGPTACVWNCPRSEEVAPPRDPLSVGEPLLFYYHGSINKDRLPVTVLEALAQGSSTAQLKVVGYETIGSIGYIRELKSYAAILGIEHRVFFFGALSRSEMLVEAAQCTVGLSFMPMKSNDTNMSSMVGASNKPFDYLAAGLMLLVSDLPDWIEMYVQPGYGLACDPSRVESLAKMIAWCEVNRKLVWAMGEAGRQRVLAEWNYEHCFAPVWNSLNSPAMLPK